MNPVISTSFGFFNNTIAGAIASDAIIPLNLVQSGGSGITSNGVGAVVLAAGVYQVTYFANGTIPASESMSINLRLNGVDVAGSVLSETGTSGDVSMLTQTIVVTVPQTGGTLQLINNSTDDVNFILVSLFVQRI